MKLCTVVGARPQFIKAAMVSRALKFNSSIKEVIIHTGQHYDTNMSEQFFKELHVPTPTYNLNIGSSSHGKQTGQMLIAIEEILLQENPDWVLVYGDTNSTLAGALVAAKLHIPVAHVEAGLRSFNRTMPEEINRITTDHISTLLFSPSDYSCQQLIKEGINASQIFNVGDVMYDAALYYSEYNAARKSIIEKLRLNKDYYLATIHRAENADCEQRLKNIFNALIELSTSIQIVLPLHPRTRKALDKFQMLEKVKKIMIIIEPIGYLDMLTLEKNAKCIITDSGGVQKEAFFFGVPCVTTRNETEWVELIENGANRLVGADTKKIIDATQQMSATIIANKQALYGTGNAAQRIVDNLI